MTPTPIATVLASAGTAFQDLQVTNGRIYLYEVTGVNVNGESYPAALVVVPFAAPGPVQPVTVQNTLHANALDLSWGAPASTFPVSFYAVYSFFTPNPTPTPIPSPATTGTTTSTFTPTPSPTTTFTITPTSSLASSTPASFLATLTPVLVYAPFTNYTDMSPVTLGQGNYYYIVVAYDSQAVPQMGALPSPLFTSPIMPQVLLAPHPPVLAGSLPPAPTPVITPNPTYGVNLYWNGALPSEGVTYYQLQRNSTPIDTVMVTQTPLPTYCFFDSSIPLAANASSAPSTYQVFAYNNFNNILGTPTPGISNALQESVYGAYLQSVQVTPNNTPGSGVTVTWGQATPGTYGLNGYYIFKSCTGLPTITGTISPTPTAIAVELATPSTTTTYCYVDTAAANANNLTYWVQPYDSVTVGVPATAPTPALILAPTPVSPVSATPVGSNNQILVSWPTVGPGFYGPPQDYVIYRGFSANPTFTPTRVATVSASVTTYTDSVAGSAGTLVAYEVSAQDPLGNSSPLPLLVPSNSVTLAVLTAPGTPQVVSISGNAATLQFMVSNPPGDSVTGYSFFGSNWPGSNPTATPVATIVPSPGATQVCYYVTATPWVASLSYAEAENSSGTGQAATLGGIAVSSYQVTAVVPVPTQEVLVSWNMGTQVPTPIATSTPPFNYYAVYRSNTSGANFAPIATVPYPVSNYPDTQVGPGTKYYYEVTDLFNNGVTTYAQSPLYTNFPAPTPSPQACIVTWPNMPPTLTANSGVTQTTLYWNSNARVENVTSYSVTQNGTAAATIVVTPMGTPMASVTPSQTCVATYSANFAETPGNLSSYQVVAQNASGFSNPAAVTVLVAPEITVVAGLIPPPGANPTPGATPAFPPLVWISGLAYPNSVGAYNIYRAVMATPSTTPVFSQIGTVSSPTSIFSDSAPQRGYINYYQAVANNNAGISANPTFVPVEAVTVWPNPPVITVPMAGSASSVSLSWVDTGNTNIMGYTVYRSVYPNVTPTVIAQTKQPVFSFTDSAVTTGSAYVYWVEAKGSGGDSGLSAPQSFIPLQQPTLAITPLAGKNLLYWSPLAPIPNSLLTGYVVYRAFIPTPGTTPVYSQVGSIVDGLSNTIYADATVSEATTYIYEVAPSSQNGILGPFSGPATQAVYPHPVSDLLAVSGDGIVQLRWLNQGVSTTTYTIQRKLGAAQPTPNPYQVIATGFQGVNYTDQGLQDKTFYDYQVISVDTSGLTAISRPVIALPAAPPVVPTVNSNGVNIAAPVSVSQSQSSLGQGNTISWPPANSPATVFNPLTMYPLGGYSIYSAPDGVTYQWLADVPPGQTSYFDNVTLINGGSYTYLVQAFDNPPNLPVTSLSEAVSEGLVHSASYSPTVAYPVGAGGALDRNSIRPFSTAANEKVVHIRLAVTTASNVEIKVYTLNGTFVKELVNSYFSVGIYGLPGGNRVIYWDGTNMNGNYVASGVYLITVEMNGHQEIDKVAVIK